MRIDEILRIDFENAVSQIDFMKPYDPFSKSFMKALFIGQLLNAAKCLKNDIEEELDGAEKYWKLYLETNDSSYKEMASDELKHAGILLKKRNSTEKNIEALEIKRQELMKVISPVQKNVV